MADPRRAALSLASRIRDPATPTAGRPPLLLLLHGVGGNELAMAAIAPSFDPRFIVVSPRAPIEMGPFAFGWFHETFTPAGPIVDDLAEARAAFARFGDFLEEAVDVVGADPARTWLAGFSQGGIVALATLLGTPERVAGAICMSGRLPAEALAMAVDADRFRGKPVLIVHGTEDPTLPIEHGRRAAADLRGLRLDVELRELGLGHTTSPESLAVVSAWLTRRLDD